MVKGHQTGCGLHGTPMLPFMCNKSISLLLFLCVCFCCCFTESYNIVAGEKSTWKPNGRDKALLTHILFHIVVLEETAKDQLLPPSRTCQQLHRSQPRLSYCLHQGLVNSCTAVSQGSATASIKDLSTVTQESAKAQLLPPSRTCQQLHRSQPRLSYCLLQGLVNSCTGVSQGSVTASIKDLSTVAQESAKAQLLPPSRTCQQ